ncbi:hypothetical protein [Shimia thalassica]|uniref:hypothetical protein n=1 Tax=Shimia thalassica TaxID=1715693 RepID=UPI0026E3C66C|nr:hypothetical protein [Shimia thalassica]MDO6800730.1 hypothetical protein [Shimia thalassica]
MKSLYALAFSLLASGAAAQDIGLKMPEIGQGSYATYKVGKATYTHVFAGKSGKYFVYDVVPGDDPEGMEGRSRYFRDGNGQTVKWVTAGGDTVTFTPHNCQRTVGACEFTEEGVSEGEPYKTRMIRTNTPTSKGFDFEQVGFGPDGKEFRLMGGSVELDDYGLMRRATVRNAEAKTKFKLVKAVIR